MLEQYKALGVSDAVLTFGEGVLADLKDRFAGIDAIAEANQMKVIAAMQKNRLAANHFNLSSGYGYDDEGRDTLERVYADCFGAEAALVRPQITCGTHALALALGANLLPGDELLSPVGGPYDTLEEVIGIRPSAGSLKEYGVSYRQVDLLPCYPGEGYGLCRRRMLRRSTSCLFLRIPFCMYLQPDAGNVSGLWSYR